LKDVNVERIVTPKQMRIDDIKCEIKLIEDCGGIVPDWMYDKLEEAIEAAAMSSPPVADSAVEVARTIAKFFRIDDQLGRTEPHVVYNPDNVATIIEAYAAKREAALKAKCEDLVAALRDVTGMNHANGVKRARESLAQYSNSEV
jgi:hypothetical protein